MQKKDFHVCVADEDNGSIYDCFEMTTSTKKGPENLTVRI
jgi:hypothetical protein